jgi:hypothetical protein
MAHTPGPWYGGALRRSKCKLPPSPTMETRIALLALRPRKRITQTMTPYLIAAAPDLLASLKERPREAVIQIAP